MEYLPFKILSSSENGVKVARGIRQNPPQLIVLKQSSGDTRQGDRGEGKAPLPECQIDEDVILGGDALA